MGGLTSGTLQTALIFGAAYSLSFAPRGETWQGDVSESVLPSSEASAPAVGSSMPSWSVTARSVVSSFLVAAVPVVALLGCGASATALSGAPGSDAVSGALTTLQLKPSADVSHSRVTGSPSSSSLFGNIDDGTSYAASDSDATYTRAYAGLGTGVHEVSYSGAPVGVAVRTVTVHYTAALGTATAGTAQVRLYDGTTLLGTGATQVLASAYGQYSDSFSALNVASANTLRTEMTLVNKAGSGGVRYSEIWLDVGLASVDAGSVDAGSVDAGSVDAGKTDGGSTLDAGTSDAGTAGFDRVFIVMMENHDASQIYGSSSAPYLNSLMQTYAYSTNFTDVLPISEVSASHYIWLEGGTNVFSDIHFTGDASPSASHSTASTAHLSSLLDTAGISWMSYQEDLNSSTGACPIVSSGHYAPKHDPFIYFQDVSGSTPSTTNTRCAAHHRPTSQLAADLASGSVARYAFITPNLCNDMHDNCGGGAIASGDAWLKTNLPAVINYAQAHRGLVLVAWDEGSSSTQVPFIAIASSLKSTGYASGVSLSLSSVTKSLQEIFRVGPAQGTPLLGHAADASTNDLADLFKPSAFP